MRENFERRILVVDDEREWTDRIKRILTEQGYKSVDGINRIGRFADLLVNEYDLAIVDLKMPRFSGFQIKDFFKTKSPSTKVLLISQHEDFGIDLLDKAKGTDGWFRKQNLDTNEMSFIVLVGELLDTGRESSKRDQCSRLPYDINIRVDLLSQHGILSDTAALLTTYLRKLKEETERSNIPGAADAKIEIDQLGLELSKNRKDKSYILGSLNRIRKCVGDIYEIGSYLDKIWELIDKALR